MKHEIKLKYCIACCLHLVDCGEGILGYKEREITHILFRETV